MRKLMEKDVRLELDQGIEISNKLIPLRIDLGTFTSWFCRDGWTKERIADEDVVESGVVNGYP